MNDEKVLSRLTVSSILAHQGLLVEGGPGGGKTTIMRTIAEMIGGGHTVYVSLDGATPPEKIQGMVDPVLALKGEYKIKTAGTPSDPATRIFVANEVSRASQLILWMLIDVYDRGGNDPFGGPVILATANFTLAGQASEAVWDRFPLRFSLPAEVDGAEAGAIARSRLLLRPAEWVPGLLEGLPLPTMSEVEEVWRMRPSSGVVDMVADAVAAITTAATASGLSVNRRRVVAMADIIFRVSAWETRGAEITGISPLALEALSCLHVGKGAEARRKWSEAVMSVADIVGTLITRFEADLKSALEEIRGLPPARYALEASRAFARVVDSASETLASVGEEAVKQATARLEAIYREAVAAGGT